MPLLASSSAPSSLVPWPLQPSWPAMQHWGPALLHARASPSSLPLLEWLLARVIAGNCLSTIVVVVVSYDPTTVRIKCNSSAGFAGGCSMFDRSCRSCERIYMHMFFSPCHVSNVCACMSCVCTGSYLSHCFVFIQNPDPAVLVMLLQAFDAVHHFYDMLICCSLVSPI